MKETLLQVRGLLVEKEYKTEQEPKDIECNRCGKCCMAFTLPYKQEDLQNRRVNPRTRRWFENIQQITNEDVLLVGVMPDMIELAADTGMHWYKCNHLSLASSGDYFCSIHSERPEACSGYKPYWMGGYQGDKAYFHYADCSYVERWDESMPVPCRSTDFFHLELKAKREAPVGKLSSIITNALDRYGKVFCDFSGLPIPSAKTANIIADRLCEVVRSRGVEVVDRLRFAWAEHPNGADWAMQCILSQVDVLKKQRADLLQQQKTGEQSEQY